MDRVRVKSIETKQQESEEMDVSVEQSRRRRSEESRNRGMRPFDLQRMVSFFLPGEDGRISRRRSNGAIELNVVYEGRERCAATDYLA